MSRYINPYTDFGFKKLFGEEANKDLLIDFLNTFLPEKHQIKVLDFKNQEQLGAADHDRRSIFDIFCENDKGEKFIVEMQKASQAYFKDRSVYYVAHPIQAQGQRGQWNFNLKTVYFIGILDFVYDHGDSEPLLIREVSLKDQHGKEFFEKLKMTYIQMPLFTKQESELTTHQEKWLYFLKNLPDLESIPAIMKEKVFKKAFHTAELAAMPETERDRYEHDLHDYWTYLSSLRQAKREGRALGRRQGMKEGREKGMKEGREKGMKEGREKGMKEGREKGRAERDTEIARNMKRNGFDMETIVEMTGLAREHIETLE